MPLQLTIALCHLCVLTTLIQNIHLYKYTQNAENTVQLIVFICLTSLSLVTKFIALTRMNVLQIRNWYTLLLCQANSPGGSTFLHEMTSWPPSWKCDVKSKTWLRQLMHVYSKNISAKFRPDPIWKVKSLRLFLKRSPQQKEEQRSRTRWVE